MRNPKSGKKFPLNEPLHIHVPNVRKAFSFYPLCEVVSSDEEPSSITSSPWKGPHYVQALLGKWPRTWEWIQDSPKLMYIQSKPLTLITLPYILLG